LDKKKKQLGVSYHRRLGWLGWDWVGS
jgi:hypothetical protein